ncbi:MAG: phosphoribosylglycinamide formyltransferase [Clostridia bacterium]|nr:phosphoribosylglycinamide formyltransferase [Clostridia bacterium]MBR6620279.1 phosphoribosylglycinamide formyltransferase [Clostridia bacterium]
MLNIVVLVSGGGTNLQALLDAKKDGKIPNGEFVKVISSKPGVYALERAAKAGVATAVVERKGKTAEEFETALLAELKAAKADLIVLAGFMTILGEKVIKEYPEKIVNVHPALIPSFCGKGFYGLKVHEAALEYGVKVTGATVHFVNEIPDGGRIIAQKAVEIDEGITAEELQKKVMEQAEWIILPQAVAKLCDERK